jgi:hypothetical protein
MPLMTEINLTDDEMREWEIVRNRLVAALVDWRPHPRDGARTNHAGNDSGCSGKRYNNGKEGQYENGADQYTRRGFEH